MSESDRRAPIAPARPLPTTHLPGAQEATTDLLTAARLIGIGRTTAYRLARTGTFPVRVLRAGHRYRVPVAPLNALLGRDEEPRP